MRLIDADVIKLPQGFFEKVDNVPKFYKWLDEQPEVDAVEVVRCKDCKFYRKTAALAMDYFDYIEGNTENKKPVYMCDNDVIDWPTPEDYCSHGKRRENG